MEHDTVDHKIVNVEPGAGLGPRRSGRVRPMILMWALGVPIPLILIIMLIRGCV